MGIRESLLNTITSVADSDFVRIVTAAGASSKATVRNLFKGFESNLSAKSSLTTSDYIRVVGSDNEAYKQTLSAVKDAMGVSKLELKSSYVNSLTGLNNVINSIDNGQPFILAIYSTDLISLLTNNGISASACQLFGSRKNATYTQYMLCIELSQEVYVGEYNISTGTVSSVYKMPTRAEINALNTKTEVTVTASANVVIDTNKSYKCGNILFLNVKGHTTAALSNASLFVFAGATANPNSFTFGIPVGPSAWEVNGMAYGYINANGVVGRITSGQYFHIAQAFLCNL